MSLTRIEYNYTSAEWEVWNLGRVIARNAQLKVLEREFPGADIVLETGLNHPSTPPVLD